MVNDTLQRKLDNIYVNHYTTCNGHITKQAHDNAINGRTFINKFALLHIHLYSLYVCGLLQLSFMYVVLVLITPQLVKSQLFISHNCQFLYFRVWPLFVGFKNLNFLQDLRHFPGVQGVNEWHELQSTFKARNITNVWF